MGAALLYEKVYYRLTGKHGLKRQMEEVRGGTLNKMVALNPKRKLLYTVIPKAANSTIKRIIWSDFEAVKHMKSLNRQHPTTAIGELTDKQIEKILQDPEWVKFSFVRNPYTRVVSAYKDKILNPKQNRNFLKKINWEKSDLPTLDEFLEAVSNQNVNEMDWHWRPQYALLMPGLIDYQHIGKIEKFAEDIQPIIDRLELDKEEAEALTGLKLNTTDKPGNHESRDSFRISDKAASLIQMIYQNDFEQFSYDAGDIIS